ncbi:conserved hypothetical protein [[Clostridium] ultunense Esp]|nr:conserved hypothetical protein [[Clostridium] ultunense Esp]
MIGAVGNLHVRDWKVLNHIPNYITVNVRVPDEDELRLMENYRNTPELKYEPIIRNVQLVSKHSKTLRYDIANTWFYPPFNSIYFPHHFFDDEEDPKLLQILVEWD